MEIIGNRRKKPFYVTQIWNSSRPEFLMNFTAIWFSEKTIKEKENQWHFFVFGFVFSFYDRHFVKAAFEFLKKIFRYFERISEPSGFSGRNFWIVLNQPNLSLVLWHLLVTLNFEVHTFFSKIIPNLCRHHTALCQFTKYSHFLKDHPFYW